MVHIMHMLFVLFAVFDNMRVFFHRPTCEYLPERFSLKTPARNGYRAFHCDGQLFHSSD